MNNNLKTKTMNNQIEVEVNGNKVTLTLTDEQINQLQKAAKKEWWEEIEYEIRNLYRENGGVARLGHLLSSNCENDTLVYKPSQYYFCDSIKNSIIFNNIEQAQLAADYMNLFTEMYNFAQLRNGKDKIDWKDENSINYGLTLNARNMTIDVAFGGYIAHIFGIYFIEGKHAIEASEIFGERIISLFSKLQNY